jgi:predicted CXXCH cytochrome family protein
MKKSAPSPRPDKRERNRSRLGKVTALLGGAATLVIVVVWRLNPRTKNDSGRQGQIQSVRNTGTTPAQFVDNALCARCHSQQHNEWLGSQHALAMQAATDQTVLGDFNDASFTYFDITSRFFTKDGKFFVHTDGPDGTLQDYEIKYTFGVTPLQQYLIELPGGRLQALSIAWDTRAKDAGGQRWFHLYPKERITHDDPLHWTKLYQNWNAMCAECHSTNVRKNYDLNTDTYHTTWAAIDVSCQACHGPGSAHVKWARAAQEGTTANPPSSHGLMVDFRSTDARYQVDACAPCHSRRHRVSAEDQSGRPLLDDFMPETLRADLYYPDGQQLDEVYVYGSFRQSKMYQAGVRCTDCHNPHSVKLRAEGNALCRQCHHGQPDPRFPTLPFKQYDTPAHHFHPVGSAGAQCVNCHMPAKTYMVVDPRRDHSLRVPRPDVSAKLGTPNACTLCHLDRTSQWAAETIAKWYGPQRRQEPHYGEVLAAGRAGQPEAATNLSALALDVQQPAIVRASAVELLAGYGPAGMEALLTATKDADPAVRATAVGSLDHVPPLQRLTAAAPLLTDPLRAVRLEAARVLAPVPAEQFMPPQRRAFTAALNEYTAVQEVDADQPAAHLNLGVLQASASQPEQAVQSYQTAIRLDPSFLPARFNLANLYDQLGRNADAIAVLQGGLRWAPQQGDLYYSLGLALAEGQRLTEAAEVLATAAALLPQRARVRYNYALTLQHLGRQAEAETALLKAYGIDQHDPDIVHALALLYAQQRHWRQALPYAETLRNLRPDAPEPRQLLQRIQEAVSAGEHTQ